MKKLLLAFAATTALAACGSNKSEETAEPIETTVAETDTATASQMAGS